MNDNHKILRIAYAHAKGEAMTHVQEAKLVQGGGLEGDYHGKNGDGLIVIISQNLLDWMQGLNVKGLCFNRFKYNICLSHSISHFQSGRAFGLGEAILKITAKNKKCFAKKQGCDVPSGTCKLQTEVKFAEIYKGGMIAVNSSITPSSNVL